MALISLPQFPPILSPPFPHIYKMDFIDSLNSGKHFQYHSGFKWDFFFFFVEGIVCLILALPV